MQGGQFDTADNLTPRTIWHHHKFHISAIVWPPNMIRNILIATNYLFDWKLSCIMSLYEIRAQQGPHIKTYLISWQLFGPKISNIESCNFFFAGDLLFSTEDIYHFSRLQHCCFIPQYSTHLSFCWLLLAPLSPFLVRVSRLITLKWDNSFCKKFPIRLTWQLWDACYKADAICWGGNWTRKGSLSQKRRCNLVSNQSSRHEICQKFYPAGFSGQQFYTLIFT